MDDQQTMFYLGYLCGLIDGEGTITIEKNNRAKRNMEMYPVISISNSDKEVVDLISKIYNYFDIQYNIHWSISLSRKGYAPNALIRVRGNSRVHKLSELIKPYLICKRFQLYVVIDFIISRDYGKSRLPYGDVEFGLLNEIRRLNLKPSTQNKII
jgi:hypothetical protein